VSAHDPSAGRLWAGPTVGERGEQERPSTKGVDGDERGETEAQKELQDGMVGRAGTAKLTRKGS
jgi:hypothetical protein